MNMQQPRQRSSVSYLPASEPTNRRLPSTLKESVPLAAQYEQLQLAEARIDATITRKRFDMQDALNRPLKVKRTMRVWCSNTVHDQAWQVAANSGAAGGVGNAGLDEHNFDFESGNVPSWTLRVVGKVLPDAALDEDGLALPLFTDLVRSVTVEAEEEGEHGTGGGGGGNGTMELFGGMGGGIGSDGPLLEYRKGPSAGTMAGSSGQQQQQPPSMPGIELNRQGDGDVNLVIALTLENVPERYKLQPSLASLLDMQTATRQEIMAGIWEYVQAEKLQDSEEKRLIHADAALAATFAGQERLFFPDLPKMIDRLLLPLDPIILRYAVKVDRAVTYAPRYWDIEVVLDSPIRATYISALQKLATPNPEIDVLNHKIADLVLQIEQSLAKKDFFESYAASPGDFVRQWLESQNYDMEVMMGDVNKVKGERARRADFYKGNPDWLRESLFHYLAEPRVI